MKKQSIKFPRVMVSAKRHAALKAEAKKRKPEISIAALAEEKFIAAGK